MYGGASVRWRMKSCKRSGARALGFRTLRAATTRGKDIVSIDTAAACSAARTLARADGVQAQTVHAGGGKVNGPIGCTRGGQDGAARRAGIGDPGQCAVGHGKDASAFIR